MRILCVHKNNDFIQQTLLFPAIHFVGLFTKYSSSVFYSRTLVHYLLSMITCMRYGAYVNRVADWQGGE